MENQKILSEIKKQRKPLKNWLKISVSYKDFNLQRPVIFLSPPKYGSRTEAQAGKVGSWLKKLSPDHCTVHDRKSIFQN